MKYKIVADSSADVLTLSEVAFSSVPLHIIVGEQDFSDDGTVDCEKMQQAIEVYGKKTSTACPAPEEWVKAFGDADVIFCVTLTSKLSGANTSANIARQIYEEANPEKRVYVFDTLTTGPEMAMFIEKIQELILEGKTEEEIVQQAKEYMAHTQLLFSLASLKNFAQNGRISPLLAKGIGVLGIRIVGIVSEDGDLQPIDKARGDGKSIEKIVNHMKECGYSGGKVRIAHNGNEKGAVQLLQEIEWHFGQVKSSIHRTQALCSYYAEPESILLGFEV